MNKQPIHSFHTLMVPVAMLTALTSAEAAIAHGVDIQYQTTQAIAVQATYDSGDPFANAQVTVYSPNSNTPWVKGSTDSSGKFVFIPDSSKPGNWEVKVRLAGHGNILNVPVKSASSAATQSAHTAAKSQSAPTQPTSAISGTGYTSLQKGVMAASVIWGLVATALFFWGRKR